MGASPGPNLLPQALLSQWAESHDFAVFIPPHPPLELGKTHFPLNLQYNMNE